MGPCWYIVYFLENKLKSFERDNCMRIMKYLSEEISATVSTLSVITLPFCI